MKAAEHKRLAELGRRMAIEDTERDPPRVTLMGRISLGDKTFRIDGENAGSTLHVIMLARGVERVYRDPEDDYTQPVCCFAVSTGDGRGMAPHERSPSPQSDACDHCRWNLYNTANKGRGKKCKEYRRIALLTPGDKTVRLLRLPPTSLAPFRNYRVRLRTKRGLEMHQAITRLGFRPSRLFPVLRFMFVKPVEEKHREEVEKNFRWESNLLLMAPY